MVIILQKWIKERQITLCRVLNREYKSPFPWKCKGGYCASHGLVSCS